MARIRTIKPEFFTSEDVVSLSPYARLLFIALWCEADREGRMYWKPKTFKMRYFPADDVNIDALCGELVERSLVDLYGDGLAEIPSFARHQHINPRESASVITPNSPRVIHASVRVSDAQGGREGKEKEDALERDPPKAVKGSRLSKDWALPAEWETWCRAERPDLDPRVTAETFRDFWVAKAGKDAAKLDWEATWRNWVRNSKPGAFKPALTAVPKSQFAGAV